MILLVSFCIDILPIEAVGDLSQYTDAEFEQKYEVMRERLNEMEQADLDQIYRALYWRDAANSLRQTYGDEEFVRQGMLLHFQKVLSSASFGENLLSLALVLMVSDDLSDTCMLRAMIPLWRPEHPGFRALLWDVLAEESRSAERPGYQGVNFEKHLEIMKEEERDNSLVFSALTDFMYEFHAFEAWMAMLELDGVDLAEREALYEHIAARISPYQTAFRNRPERLRPGVREELHQVLLTFYQDDSLWARVFAAEILNKVPYLRDPEIEATLREDPHWLIQRRMAYLEDEEEPDSETTDER